MCETCGCGDHETVAVEVGENILVKNEAAAHHNREHFAEQGVLALNVMGSPGGGKTALLEATARRLADRRMGAVTGDLETHNDASRLRAAGIPSVAITTGSACHLDAKMVHHALHGLHWTDIDFLFIENVGNLVCPAVYDLGQAESVVVLSVTEGEDKPLKYPVMFRKAALVVVTKIDLLPHLDLSMESLRENLARVMPVPRIVELSARTGEGMGGWTNWLEERRTGLRAAPLKAGGTSPR